MYKVALTAAIVIVILTLYEAFKPLSYSQRHNFVALPSLYADSPVLTNSRCSALNACSGLSDCAKCGTADPKTGARFVCTTVTTRDNIVYEGATVPEGKWCLPEGRELIGCGEHTGRSVWTDRGWECTCLYPSLWGGPSCTDQLACRVFDLRDADGALIDQSKNVLVDANGQKWDPKQEGFDPGDSTPYDKNADGTAKYQCSCDSTGIKKFIKFPGDDFRCHLDPCSDTGEINMWDGQKCDCNAGGVAKGQYAKSNVTKTCVRTPQCVWDDDKNQCQCPEGHVSKTCDSASMSRPGQEKCDYPGGSYCINPCDNYCEAGGIGTVVGDKCVCKCPIKKTFTISGERCQNVCRNDGEFKRDDMPCCNGSHYVAYAGADGALTGQAEQCGPNKCTIL